MNQTRFDRELLAWVAGLFEGEGSISIIRRKDSRSGYIGFALHVGVIMTDPEPIDLLHACWGGYIYSREQKTARYKPVWHWYLARGRAALFLRDIAPFVRTLRIKEKIVLAFEFQKHKVPRGTINKTPIYKATEARMAESMKVIGHKHRMRVETK